MAKILYIQSLLPVLFPTLKKILFFFCLHWIFYLWCYAISLPILMEITFYLFSFGYMFLDSDFCLSWSLEDSEPCNIIFDFMYFSFWKFNWMYVYWTVSRSVTFHLISFHFLVSLPEFTVLGSLIRHIFSSVSLHLCLILSASFFSLLLLSYIFYFSKFHFFF